MLYISFSSYSCASLKQPNPKNAKSEITSQYRSNIYEHSMEKKLSPSEKAGATLIGTIMVISALASIALPILLLVGF